MVTAVPSSGCRGWPSTSPSGLNISAARMPASSRRYSAKKYSSRRGTDSMRDRSDWA